MIGGIRARLHLRMRDGEIWTYRVVNVPAPGRYGLFVSPTIDDPVEGYVELKQCAGGCDSFHLRILVPTSLTPARWFDIEEAGDYILKLAVRPPAAQAIGFQLLGVDCG